MDKLFQLANTPEPDLQGKFCTEEIKQCYIIVQRNVPRDLILNTTSLFYHKRTF